MVKGRKNGRKTAWRKFELEIHCPTVHVNEYLNTITANERAAEATVVTSITSNKQSDAPLRRVTFNDTVDVQDAADWNRNIEHTWMRYRVCIRCSGITIAELNEYKGSEMDVHKESYDNTRFHQNNNNPIEQRVIPHFPCPCPTCNNYDGSEPPHYRLSKREQGSDYLRTQYCYYCLPHMVCPNYKKHITAEGKVDNDNWEQNYQRPENSN